MLSARRQTYGRGSTTEYAFEESLLHLKVAADRIGHQVVAAERVDGRLITLPVDENKAFGFMYRKRAQNDLIEQRVDGSGCADSERERKHCRGRKRGTAEKGTRGEAQVVREVPQPSSQPNITHFLLDLRDAAEFQRGLPSAPPAPANPKPSDHSRGGRCGTSIRGPGRSPDVRSRNQFSSCFILSCPHQKSTGPLP